MANVKSILANFLQELNVKSEKNKDGNANTTSNSKKFKTAFDGAFSGDAKSNSADSSQQVFDIENIINNMGNVSPKKSNSINNNNASTSTPNKKSTITNNSLSKGSSIDNNTPSSTTTVKTDDKRFDTEYKKFVESYNKSHKTPLPADMTEDKFKQDITQISTSKNFQGELDVKMEDILSGQYSYNYVKDNNGKGELILSGNFNVYDKTEAGSIILRDDGVTTITTSDAKSGGMLIFNLSGSGLYNKDDVKNLITTQWKKDGTTVPSQLDSALSFVAKLGNGDDSFSTSGDTTKTISNSELHDLEFADGKAGISNDDVKILDIANRLQNTFSDSSKFSSAKLKELGITHTSDFAYNLASSLFQTSNGKGVYNSIDLSGIKKIDDNHFVIQAVNNGKKESITVDKSGNITEKDFYNSTGNTIIEKDHFSVYTVEKDIYDADGKNIVSNNTYDMQGNIINYDKGTKITEPDGTTVIQYGQPDKWKSNLDNKQGDNDKGYVGDCGLASCENVLIQLGIFPKRANSDATQTGNSSSLTTADLKDILSQLDQSNQNNTSTTKKKIDTEESTVVDYASENDLCNNNGPDDKKGGTSPGVQVDILKHFGIDAKVNPNTTLNDLGNAIKNGSAVILEVSSSILWTKDPNASPQMDHAVTLTGVAYDANDPTKIVGFYVCDTGSGHPCEYVSADLMKAAFCHKDGEGTAVITAPIKQVLTA